MLFRTFLLGSKQRPLCGLHVGWSVQDKGENFLIDSRIKFGVVEHLRLTWEREQMEASWQKAIGVHWKTFRNNSNLTMSIKHLVHK